MSYVPGPPPPPSADEQAALDRHASTARRLPKRYGVTLAAALSEWAVILGCFALCIAVPRWWVWLGAATLVGCRQHGLLVLMHEAVHGQFHRRPRVNDRLANVLCAWPLYISTAAYRASHLQHHRALHSPQDPDWVMRHDRPEWGFPMAPLRLLWVVGSLGVGRGVISFFQGNRRMAQVSESVLAVEEQGTERAVRIGFAVVPFVLAWALGVLPLFLVVWVLPILTVLPVLVRLRVIGEHYGMRADSVFSSSRDWSAGPVLDWLLVPWGIRVHRVHHLYPGVPFHQLLRLRATLAEDPVIGEHFELQGPRAVWRDLTR